MMNMLTSFPLYGSSSMWAPRRSDATVDRYIQVRFSANLSHILVDYFVTVPNHAVEHSSNMIIIILMHLHLPFKNLSITADC